ncbi:MAG: hypothetical protein M3076_07220 [Actinomycetota bacterium]|nr:hypothetical protein [Actinomycetota bacterium]
MLTTLSADAVPVVYRALRLLSGVCCGFVVISFVMFADAQLSSASRHQQREIATGVSPATPAPPSSPPRGQPGRFIDAAANELTAPFRTIVESNDQWVQRSLATVSALAFYGIGLGFLARYSRV